MLRLQSRIRSAYTEALPLLNFSWPRTVTLRNKEYVFLASVYISIVISASDSSFELFSFRVIILFLIRPRLYIDSIFSLFQVYALEHGSYPALGRLYTLIQASVCPLARWPACPLALVLGLPNHTAIYVFEAIRDPLCMSRCED